MSDKKESTGVTISDAAAKRIAVLVTKEASANAKLRISVDGGGCSGFQYDFAFDDTQNNDDILIKAGDAIVLIDSISADLIDGSVIDYVDTLEAAHFVVKNPLATATCGCGNSFSV